ncbi:UDP-N-acetyl-D-mannosamine dehydrogenase [Sphingomonas sp. SUN039]|uniref:UDP-N-acetyl-D-mannosamine dehydrogenase n=1 Tax=Sphingomonas sp. SUN039 TaxID=2937787 RepID=UPI002164E2BC|nr:UDP-N-acetyl-D-mannosamine dehydrogenase [Sphingomonas sp. SUN039]UVO52853.1 UDP-N-acetyl-D-mannosamine dehydrogenase [Sphingomonas sp. SUN039]
MKSFRDPATVTASIYGLGYVGLPTAAVLADAGITVIGVDVNEAAVASINNGRAHIVETNLDEVLGRVVERGKLRATIVPAPADVFLIAVPTPFKGDKEPDLRFVESASRMIAAQLQPGNLVILESTSPVGTTEQISRWLAEERADLVFPHQDGKNCSVHIAHCPERILPGRVLHEVVHNDRIVGGMTARCSELAVEFYSLAVKGACHVTNARTAELCKLSENAFRDVNIAFANELSLICDKFGIDVWELIGLTNKHPRVEILRPGAGVGGHCIAVDPWFIVDMAPGLSRLIATARRINDAKPHWVADKIREAALTCGKQEPTIACMGLAYKPDVDDFRESPAVEVTALAAAMGIGRVIACDPFAEVAPPELGQAQVPLVDLAAALEADVIVFLTAHTVFKSIEPAQLAGRAVIDPCGLFEGQ